MRDDVDGCTVLSVVHGAAVCPRRLHCAVFAENSGLGRPTFPILRQTASWMVEHFVVMLSAIGQPTWPTQPSIPPGSVNDVIVGYGDERQKAW